MTLERAKSECEKLSGLLRNQKYHGLSGLEDPTPAQHSGTAARGRPSPKAPTPDPVLPAASFCRAPAFSRCPRTHLPGTDTCPEAQHGDSTRCCPLGPDREDRPRPRPEAGAPGLPRRVELGPPCFPSEACGLEPREAPPCCPHCLAPAAAPTPSGPRASSLAGNQRQKRAAGFIPAAHTQVGRGAALTARPLPEAGGGGRGKPRPCGRRGSRRPRSSRPGAAASGTGW